MDYVIRLDASYLGIPVYSGQPCEMLEIICGDKKLYEFQVPAQRETGEADYYSYINMEDYRGRTITVKGNFSKTFQEAFIQSDAPIQERIVRPLLHFTPERGWLNDPNGLVYQNGQYHLYFQHNPMDTRWGNMSWGHAVSRDLLHFEFLDPVLYPDQYGAVYSGCGLVNERSLLGLSGDALVFYYTAAGGKNAWSGRRKFTQRIAVSTDGGRRLEKLPREALGMLEEDSRDPKVFWHEETGAYIMVLWLCGNTFGFFRSEDLQNWENTSRIELEGGFECPDLFPLCCEEETVWVFTCADGLYYLGQFDGYVFYTDGVQKRAYLNGLPYAAQTYSGTKDRVISIPWLRTCNEGKPYTGMMGLPKELGLTGASGGMRLVMRPVKEFENTKTEYTSFTWKEEGYSVRLTEETVAEIELTGLNGQGLRLSFFDQELTVADQTVFYRGTKTALPEELQDLRILIDRDVLEFSGNGGTLNAWYETGSDLLLGEITIKGGTGTGKIYIWKP